MKINSGHILLFDGICNLCNWYVQFIINRDPKEKFKFASLQSKKGQELLQKLGLPTEEFNSLVYINGNKSFTKSSAVLNVLKELGGAWKISYLFIIIPMRLRDFIYSRIAKSRYKIFGKRNKCMIPKQGIKNRFLD